MKPLYPLFVCTLLVGTCLLVGWESCTSKAGQASQSTSQAPAQELSLDTLVVEDTLYEKPLTREGLSVQVKLHFLYPRQDSVLRRLFTHAFYGSALQYLTPQEATASYLDKLKKQYLVHELSDEGGLALDEQQGQSEVEMTSALVHQGEQVLTLEKEVTTHVVGAALLYHERYYTCIDRAAGRLLHESDLFVEGYAPLLAELLNRHLKEDYSQVMFGEQGTSYSEDLSYVLPNGNFAILPEGLLYSYNPGEAAPRTLGFVDVVIPYEELRPLLRPQSLLYAYLPAL